MKIIEKLVFSWHAARIAWYEFDDSYGVFGSEPLRMSNYLKIKLEEIRNYEEAESISDRVRRLCDEDLKNAGNGNA